MSRKSDYDMKRVQTLREAITEASNRCKEKQTILVMNVMLHPVVIMQMADNNGAVARLLPALTTMPSWRVGRNPDDKYFNIKLIPELGQLAIPLISDTDHESEHIPCYCVTPEELNALYKPFEIREIIKLLNQTSAT
jgi:hypothetical protein